MLVGTSSPVVLWTLMKKLFWTKRERSQPDTKPTTQYWVTTEEWGYGYKVTSKSVTLVTFVRIKIQLIEKTSTSGSKYYKYKTWWNVPTHKPEILSSLTLASSREQKGEKTSTNPSQIRTDCFQCNESLSHEPVTGYEHCYFKGDYRRSHSVLLRPYSLCPGISK